jgi:gas vesicle protein
MTVRAAKSMAAEEAAAIEDLVSDLEKRLRRISGKARRETSGASDEIADFVNDALDRIMARVRENTADLATTHFINLRRKWKIGLC